MSQPDSALVRVRYHDPQAGYGDVVGALRILDDQLCIMATHNLSSGPEIEVSVPGPGWYVAQGVYASGERFSTTFRVVHVSDPTTVTLLRRVPGRQLDSGTMDGWIAAWDQRERSSRSPLAAAVFGTAEGGLTVRSRRNVAVQMAIGTSAAFSSVLAPGLAMQVADYGGPPGHQLVPADPLTATMLAFLHGGDVTSARLLTPHRLPAPDSGLAMVIGYQFVRCHDERLDRWTSALTEARPDSVDAHLLRGCALLRQQPRISEAFEAFAEAARHGLPVVSCGLRLFDNALRILGQGRDRPGVEALRRQYLPYLRSAFDISITGFWCTPSNEPSLEPMPVAAPSHALGIRLVAARTRWLVDELAPRTPAAPLTKRLQEALRRMGGHLLGLFSVALATSGTVRDSHGNYTGTMLDLPSEVETLLGGAVLATVTRAGDDILILVANVELSDTDTLRLAVVVGDTDVVEFQRLAADALYARIPWSVPDLPDGVHVVLWEME